MTLTLPGNKVWELFPYITAQVPPHPPICHLSPRGWHPRPLAWSHFSVPLPASLPHTPWFQSYYTICTGSTSGPWLKLFHLLGTHLLPTTVSTLYSDEFSSIKGPNSPSLVTHFMLPWLGSLLPTLLSGAFHIMLRGLGLISFSICPMTTDCMALALRLTQHRPEGLAQSSLQWVGVL